MKKTLPIAIITSLLTSVGCGGVADVYIFDWDSRQPVKGATLVVERSFFSISEKSSMLTEIAADTLMLHHGNHFRKLYFRGMSLEYKVYAKGYRNFRTWTTYNNRDTLWLKKRVFGNPEVFRSQMRIGMYQNGVPIGYDFSERDTTSVLENSDIFPIAFEEVPGTGYETIENGKSVKHYMDYKVVLIAPGAGGFRLVSAGSVPPSAQPLDYLDVAPASGYLDSLIFDTDSDDELVWLRRRSGKHFAKIKMRKTGWQGGRYPRYFLFSFDSYSSRVEGRVLGK